MKTLLIAMLLILGYMANANDLVKLNEHEEKSEYLIPNRACFKAASVYMKMLDKLSLESSEFPFLKSSHEGKELLISGEVTIRSGKKIIEITETVKDSGLSVTTSIPYPASPSILVFKNPNGADLQIHATEECTKMGNLNNELKFACEAKGEVTRKIVTNFAQSKPAPDTKLFQRMGDMAEFHKKNNVAKKMEDKNIKMPERYARACLSNQETEKFSSEKVFAEMFPKTPFINNEANGFGGGTGTVRVATSRR